MPVKGSYLALTGGGAILLWSGLRGKRWSDTFRNLVAGQQPQTTTTAYAIQGTPASALAGTGGSGGLSTGGISTPGPGETAWGTTLLASIGAPPTPSNLRSLVAWRTKESPWNSSPPDGAMWTNNPLNTTWPASGATSINSVGVKKYPNVVTGIAATRATLLSGTYPDIVSALRSGRGLCGQSFAGLSTWSGGGYSSVC